MIELIEPSTGSAEGGDTVDLATCDREPIRIPGSIQPHGTLVVVYPADGTILQAAANAEAILGRPAEGLLGLGLADLLGEASAARLRTADLTPGHPQPFQPSPVAVTGRDGIARPLDCLAHLSLGRMLVEFEPRTPLPEADEAAIAMVCARAMTAMAAARSLTAAAGLAVGAIAVVTGFDRVMVYRFHEDWHGEVIAERHNGLPDSYLGLHYPATDIPVQARRMYAENLLRVIADTGYRPVPLLPRDDPRTGQPLDMTHVGLRSVSPLHLEYLGNMGVRATVTVSVLAERRLWGMIACHHLAPKRVPAAVRAAVQQLGIVFAAQVARLTDRRRLTEAAAQRTVADRLVAGFESAGSVAAAVAAGADGLLALLGGERLLWRIDGTAAASGPRAADDLPAETPAAEDLAVEALRRAAAPC